MIEGKKINLRTVRKDDLEELYKLDSNINSKGNYDGFNIPSAVEYLKDFEKNGHWSENEGVMLVTDKNDKIIGLIGYHKSSPIGGYEAGYIIYKKENRGKGYMSEAFRLFTSFMFELRDIPRLYLYIVPENIPSIKLAEKCGYKKEGLLRKACYIRGKYMDFAIYSLLKEESTPFNEVLDLK